jgi:hypothetical protein
MTAVAMEAVIAVVMNVVVQEVTVEIYVANFGVQTLVVNVWVAT